MRIPSGSIQCGKLVLSNFLVIGVALFYPKDVTLAQVTPDTTLGTENSVVKPLDPTTDLVDGGAIRGANAFHSFQEFNVNQGRAVYFNSPTGIENILSRVTGGNPSNILGKLGVLGGNANLFLINPNGIIFGANAALDVRGSFVATTANAIGFGDRGFFSASTPNLPPVLTVNPSALLFNQVTTAAIAHNSQAPAGERLDPTPFDPSTTRTLIGLRVPDNKSLLLVGGNVNLDGGGLNALGGRVELGGVASSGTVGLNVNGNDLSLSFPDGVALSDISLTNRASVDTSGEGSGNIQLQGKQITLSGGSQIAADTLGAKAGGLLSITASDSVNLIGFTPDGILSSRTFGIANAGSLTINTQKLIVQDGAQVSTTANDKGSAGKLTVNASKSVEVLGSSSRGTPSGLFSSTLAAGNAGDITINTGKLIVRDGAIIATGSSRVEDPFGMVELATGRGGNLSVNASESVEIAGTTQRGLPSSLSVSALGAADADNIKIATKRLVVRDRAAVAVSSEGTADAGNIQVQANFIRLENQGKFIATSASGEGGNITLNNLDLLLLQGNSKIATDATAGARNGGNINIDTDLLAVVENSKITADAVKGNGGNIRITTQGLFRSLDSTIRATSQQGINGVVEINRPDVDPSADLVILPAEIIDISGLVAQGCLAGGRNIAASEFVITGRGGLPPNPAEVTRSDRVLADLGKPFAWEEDRAKATLPVKAATSELIPRVEANSWVVGSQGEVVLTAAAPTTSDIPWLTPTSCHRS